MVRPHGVNLLNLVTECRCLVNQKLEEIMFRGFSGEQFELAIDCSSPRNDNSQGNLRARVRRMTGGAWVLVRTYNYGTHGIQI